MPERLYLKEAYGSFSFCSRCGRVGGREGKQRPEWDMQMPSSLWSAGSESTVSQLNAAINLYTRTRFGYTVKWEGGKKRVELKMEGASQHDRWDRTVLPSLLGGCVLTGAERKTPDELARELSEAQALPV